MIRVVSPIFSSASTWLQKNNARVKLETYLLSLLEVRELLLSSPLGRLSTSLGIQNKVPPPEAAGIVSNKLLVMFVVMFGTSPERQEMVETPGKLVAAMGIDGLEQAEDNPGIHCQDVKVFGNSTPYDWPTNCSEAQNHDLDG